MLAIAEKHDIASYAEDIHYSGSQDTENVTLNLEKLSEILFQWYFLNQMTGTPDKYHLSLSASGKVTMNV